MSDKSDSRTLPHRFRFGVELTEPLPGSTWVDSSIELERLGYSTVFMVDHVHEGPGPLAALGAVAARTEQLRIGTLVLGVDFRHPAILARELATVDQISDGRLEVGLGAGYNNHDYSSTGIVKESAAIRFERLQEYVEVLRGLWNEGSFSFAGKHYTIDDLDGSPAPHSPGGPPIIIGGGGPKLLRWAGSTADIVGVAGQVRSGAIDLAAAQDSLPDRFDEKLSWLREGAGERFDKIELNTLVSIAAVTDDSGVADSIAEGLDVDVGELHSSPASLIGTIEECEARLVERRDRWGFSYIVLPVAVARDFAPLVTNLTGT